MSESITIKERPIIFSGNMVRAILDGHKTQTRRIVKTPTQYGIESCDWTGTGFGQKDSNGTCSCEPVKCPYGFVGDQLWVRETFVILSDYDVDLDQFSETSYCKYRADGEIFDWYDEDGALSERSHWRPSIHMPREASRITLGIKNIRVERLQDISEEDSKAEGIEIDSEECDHVRYSCSDIGCLGQTYKSGFAKLWIKLHGHNAWSINPWVWVIEFEKK
ncbi:hypothetical protein LEP1GSC126_0072 [Leptospira kirschneri str. 200801774]|uniref:hypothetical protein n=1 Tax=Leptospira kirschneri TaxID=29507 RepID=UPI0002BF09C6|nr:hypothetical protein LEP1GSC126_0072 [Leptospira kirschneri str. 200801774]